LVAALQETLQAALAERYTLDREIGRGGMATVYAARDLKHDRLVALKVLDPELSMSLGVERFLREIKMVARLQHPHILPLYDSGEADGALFYVMPYVAGDSLRVRLMRDGRLSVDEALRLTADIAGALDYAHRNDIVHRDIKPENILLNDGHAIVADFGIARAVSVATSTSTSLTQAGLAVGTAAYMSPEQVTGDQNLDGRSDIYSLGCVLYEMLTGQPPFTGASALAVMARRFVDPPPSPQRTRGDLPDFVEAIVARALARDANDRFGTAAEFGAHVSNGTAPGTRRSPRHAAPRSNNPEATELYHRARGIVTRRDRARFPLVLVDLQRAMTLDPSFAAAEALSAVVHLLRADLEVDLQVACAAALAAARQSLAHDHTLDEAHAALGFAHALLWNWAEARDAFAEAARLTATGSLTLHWRAIYLTAVGKLDEARLAMAAALALDPDSAVLQTAAGAISHYARDPRDAEAHFRRAIDLDPSDAFPHLLIAQSFALRGATVDAVAEVQRSIDLAGTMFPLAQATLGCTFANMGRRSDALTVRDDLGGLARRSDISPFYEAAVRAALGESEAAIALLKQGVATHDSWVMAVKVHPWLDPLRREPAFIELMTKVGL
jgi:tetratricopeptide (TPR) repeat protein/tRNA A-37 threonylcarbamoyl transferase component Bud32